jgi:hypothetical protein
MPTLTATILDHLRTLRGDGRTVTRKPNRRESTND